MLDLVEERRLLKDELQGERNQRDGERESSQLAQELRE